MAEQIQNFGHTTLAEGLDDTETGVDVTDGSVFPASGNFRVQVENELMLVTARSTNTLTVTRGVEGTTAAAHDSGLPIDARLTAAGLTTMIQEASPALTVEDESQDVQVTNIDTIVFPDGTVTDLTGGAVSVREVPFGVAAARAVRTAGDLTLNSTSWADVNNGLDLVIPAQAGDVLLIAADGRWGNEAVFIGLDAVTVVSGSPVSSVSGSGASDYGVTGWGAQGLTGLYEPFGAAIQYPVVAGDVSGGNVTLRLRYKTATGSAKTLAASANYPLHWSAFVIGSGNAAGLPTARAVRTAGNLTLNSTTWANVDTGLDVVIPAQAGDVLQVSLAALWGNDAVVGYLDACTLVSGSPVNYISGGAGGASHQGVSGWWANSSVYTSVGGSVQYPVVAGDISGGNVTLRLRYRTNSAANKTMWADSNHPLIWSVVNLKGGARASSPYPAGTAFPTSPTTGQLYYRTDVRGGMLFRYDGTRWVSDQEFSVSLSDVTTTDDTLPLFALPKDYKVWVTSWDHMTFKGGGGSTTLTLQSALYGGTYTDLDTSTFTMGNTVWEGYTRSVGVQVDATGALSGSNPQGLVVNCNLPGSGTYLSIVVRFRLVAT